MGYDPQTAGGGEAAAARARIGHQTERPLAARLKIPDWLKIPRFRAIARCLLHAAELPTLERIRTGACHYKLPPGERWTWWQHARVNLLAAARLAIFAPLSEEERAFHRIPAARWGFGASLYIGPGWCVFFSTEEGFSWERAEHRTWRLGLLLGLRRH